MKKVLLSLSLVFFSIALNAQSGALSPYAMYGIGSLVDQTNSASRSMGGVSQGFNEGNQVNYLNPASYANIDSLSFIFDIGMSLQKTQFEEGDVKLKKNVADFEYFMAGCRLLKHVGLGFGILPVSEINYSFSSSALLSGFRAYPYTIHQSYISETTQYYGDGGVHQAFIGAGWNPWKGLAIGFNAMYMWGTLDRMLYLSYSDSSIKQLTKEWTQNVSRIRFNIGVQYTYSIDKVNSITGGLTYTPETSLGGSAYKTLVNYSTASADTTNFTADGGYHIPTEIAFGFGFRHGNKWRVGIDYSLQKWSSLDDVCFIDALGTRTEGSLGSYDDRHHFAIGGEWCKNPQGRSFLDKVKIRGGFSYTSSYLKMNTMTGEHNGPKEISATIGFGIPIINTYNNRSILNIGFQWVNESGSLIKENTYRINLALTFNERWFAKWKFE